jgi:hypothetical protein
MYARTFDHQEGEGYLQQRQQYHTELQQGLSCQLEVTVTHSNT